MLLKEKIYKTRLNWFGMLCCALAILYDVVCCCFAIHIDTHSSRFQLTSFRCVVSVQFQYRLRNVCGFLVLGDQMRLMNSNFVFLSIFISVSLHSCCVFLFLDFIHLIGSHGECIFTWAGFVAAPLKLLRNKI